MAERVVALRGRFSTVMTEVKFTFYVDQIAVWWVIRIPVNIHRKDIQLKKGPLRVPILMNGEATTDLPG
jgi:hypothetical protein